MGPRFGRSELRVFAARTDPPLGSVRPSRPIAAGCGAAYLPILQAREASADRAGAGSRTRSAATAGLASADARRARRQSHPAGHSPPRLALHVARSDVAGDG